MGESWALIVSIVAAVIALVALIYTRKAANAAAEQTQMQRQQWAEARHPAPWIDVRPDPDRSAILVAILGNSGPTIAHNVTVTFDPPIVPGEQPLRCLEAQADLRNGIGSLVPGRQILWSLGVGHELLSAPGQPDEIGVSLQARAGDGTQLTEQWTLRLADIRYSSGVAKSAESIARSLSSIDKTTKALALRQTARTDPATE